jgi:hypothetical protein
MRIPSFIVGSLISLTLANSAFGAVFVPHADGAQFAVLVEAQATLKDRLIQSIKELQQNNPNYNNMEPTLQIAVKQQLPMIQNRLQMLGNVKSVDYVGNQNGSEVYQVAFDNGVTAWAIQLGPSGKISTLWFQ